VPGARAGLAHRLARTPRITSKDGRRMRSPNPQREVRLLGSPLVKRPAKARICARVGQAHVLMLGLAPNLQGRPRQVSVATSGLSPARQTATGRRAS
jgi:hypothetical protein